MASGDPGLPGDDNSPDLPRRKATKRTHRAYVEEPLYLLPAHYTLLQDSTYELLRGLAGLSAAVEDDPLYFDQLLAAAVNVKHAFDLGRMDVINGTIRPRNTSLCHECITTVSSVWRSGPEGPRTLCNACGLRFYKQSQRRALEARRREIRETGGTAVAAPQGTTPDSSNTELPQAGADSAMEDAVMDDAVVAVATAVAAVMGDSQPHMSPEPTRPSITNLCGPPMTPPPPPPPRMPFFPSISNILTSPAATPEPPACHHSGDGEEDGVE